MDLKEKIEQREGELQQAIINNDLLRQQLLKVEEQIKQSDFYIAGLQGEVKAYKDREVENKK